MSAVPTGWTRRPALGVSLAIVGVLALVAAGFAVVTAQGQDRVAENLCLNLPSAADGGAVAGNRRPLPGLSCAAHVR